MDIEKKNYPLTQIASLVRLWNRNSVNSYVEGSMKYLLLCALTTIGITKAYSQTLPYLDEQFSCFSAARADSYIKDFNINVASFGGKELCQSAVDIKKLINDIIII